MQTTVKHLCIDHKRSQATDENLSNFTSSKSSPSSLPALRGKGKQLVTSSRLSTTNPNKTPWKSREEISTLRELTFCIDRRWALCLSGRSILPEPSPHQFLPPCNVWWSSDWPIRPSERKWRKSVFKADGIRTPPSYWIFSHLMQYVIASVSEKWRTRLLPCCACSIKRNQPERGWWDWRPWKWTHFWKWCETSISPTYFHN